MFFVQFEQGHFLTSLSIPIDHRVLKIIHEFTLMATHIITCDRYANSNV